MNEYPAEYPLTGFTVSLADLVARVEPDKWVAVADDIKMPSSERVAIFDRLGDEMQAKWSERRHEAEGFKAGLALRQEILREIIAKRDAIFGDIAAKHKWDRDNKAFFAIMGVKAA